MPAEQRRHVTDMRVLRAMANPVRYRIFSHLMAAGEQTASECAAVVGASASNCSYHPGEDERDDPAARLASTQLIHLGIDDTAALAHAATDAHEALTEDWRDASVLNSYGLRVSPAELAALGRGRRRPAPPVHRDDP